FQSMGGSISRPMMNITSPHQTRPCASAPRPARTGAARKGRSAAPGPGNQAQSRERTVEMAALDTDGSSATRETQIDTGYLFQRALLTGGHGSHCGYTAKIDFRKGHLGVTIRQDRTCGYTLSCLAVMRPDFGHLRGPRQDVKADGVDAP